MGKVDYVLIPYTRSCLFCTEMISDVDTTAHLHCWLRHGKQRVVTLADFAARKATGEIIHHLTTAVYLIYQVMWSRRKIHALLSPRKWPYLAYTWPYWFVIYCKSKELCPGRRLCPCIARMRWTDTSIWLVYTYFVFQSDNCTRLYEIRK